MKSRRLSYLRFLALLLCFSGCFTTQKKVYNAVLPKVNDVLIYDLPYDLTFLKAVDVLQTHPDWDLESTDKEAGKIKVYNKAVLRFNDSDERHITFLVKRMNRSRTSIEIDPEDQTVVGARDLLKRVAASLGQQF